MIVLYVDDSETMQQVAEITLRDTDFEYVGARTVEDGYRLALDRQPMLILIDADDAGYALCARLKAEPALAGVLVIMVCGNSQPYDATRGADGMLAKPWDTQRMLDKLADLVAEPPPAPEPEPEAKRKRAEAPARPAAAAPAPPPPGAVGRSQIIMGMPSIQLPPAPMSPPAQPVVIAPAFEEAPAEPEKPRYVDDNVQFTVYRPKVMPPAKWHPLLAFAHLAEKRDDEDDVDPIEEVQRQAQQVLGDDAARFTDTTQDATASIPAEGELTIVPELAGIEVNPRARSFLWTEPVHREEFRIRAGAALDGQTVRGKVTVWLGSLIVAEVPLAIRIHSGASTTDAAPAVAKARPYRKIFASYSHRDAHIVDEVSRLARALGDEYTRDWVHLRSGQVWNDQLRTLIAEADIFQLFWSHNAMRSRYCKEEWEYALSLGRSSFVRPTYWEDPMPADPTAGMPPEALVRLHFQKIRVATEWAAPPAVAEAPPEPKQVAEKTMFAVSAPRPSMPAPAFAEPAAMTPMKTQEFNVGPPAAGGRGPWLAIAVLVIAAAVIAWLLLR